MKILNEKTITTIISKTKPDKCGYLLKKCSEYKKTKTFKRRYFVLIGNLLIYFEKKPYPVIDSEPCGVVFLEGHLVEMISDPKLNYVFQISFGPVSDKPLKMYILAAESDGDLKDWIQALITAGSDYFKIKETDYKCQVKAIKEVISCQLDASNVERISKDYRSSNHLLSDLTDPYFRELLSMTFEDMHKSALKYFSYDS